MSSEELKKAIKEYGNLRYKTGLFMQRNADSEDSEELYLTYMRDHRPVTKDQEDKILQAIDDLYSVCSEVGDQIR